jgi:hypothetical protein
LSVADTIIWDNLVSLYEHNIHYSVVLTAIDTDR